MSKTQLTISHKFTGLPDEPLSVARSFVFYREDGRVMGSGFGHVADIPNILTQYEDIYGCKLSVMHVDRTFPPDFATVRRKSGRGRKASLHEERARDLEVVHHEEKHPQVNLRGKGGGTEAKAE